MIGSLLLSPWLSRVLVLAAVALTTFVVGRAAGIRAERATWVAAEQVRLAAESAAQSARDADAARRAEAAAQVAASAAVTVERVRTVTKTVIKEVPVYVPLDTPDLPAGWRVLHDAAATGRVPDPSAAAGPDAAPVSAQDAAATVIDNYGTCREDQARLAALQEYVRSVME